jgi:hypothetical protein
LGETKAVPRQVVETGSFDLAAIATEVRVTQIVGKDEDNIWFRIRRGFCAGCHTEEIEKRERDPTGKGAEKVNTAGSHKMILRSVVFQAIERIKEDTAGSCRAQSETRFVVLDGFCATMMELLIN